LAVYTLVFPLFQALMMLYLPVSLWTVLAVKVATPVALLSTLPLYLVVGQLVICVLGIYEFTAVHRLRLSLLTPVYLALAYFPYQWLLALAALRAVWRQLLGVNTWEKTTHVGAHRPNFAPSGNRSGHPVREP
jgi:glycosyltransferase XagB